jgi:hypothetical protein
LRLEAPPPEVAPEWEGEGAARPSMGILEGSMARVLGRSGSRELPKYSRWHVANCLTRVLDTV